MFEVRMPKEIRAYKEKLFFNMTARQLICSSIAVLSGALIYVKGKDFFGRELSQWLVIIIGMSLGSLGFFSKNGMPIEQYVYAILKTLFIYPRKRVYKSEDLIDYCIEEEYRELKDELAEINKKKR